MKINRSQRIAIYLLSVFLPVASIANPRLDRVQETYHQGVDLFISKQLDRMFDAFNQVIEILATKSLVELSTQAAEIEKRLLSVTQDAQNSDDLALFLKEQQRLQVSLAHIGNVERESQQELKKLKSGLARLNQRDICTANARSILLQLVPEYAFDESIDVSDIPKPKHCLVEAAVGSEIEAADTIEKSLYLPATTGGCAAGQAILWFLPVIGCLIGAGVGAAVAYGAGKATTAIMTGIENQKESDAYNHAVSMEKARQQAEIDQARAWIKQYPISDDVIMSRAMNYCMALPFTSQEKHLVEAEKWIKTPKPAIDALTKKVEKLSEQRKEVRKKTLDAMKTRNLALLLERMAQSRKLGQEEKRDIFKREIRQALATCLLEESSSCDGIGMCVLESQAEFDTLALDDPSFSTELAKLRQEISVCKEQEENT